MNNGNNINIKHLYRYNNMNNIIHNRKSDYL